MVVIVDCDWDGDKMVGGVCDPRFLPPSSIFLDYIDLLTIVTSYYQFQLLFLNGHRTSLSACEDWTKNTEFPNSEDDVSSLNLLCVWEEKDLQKFSELRDDLQKSLITNSFLISKPFTKEKSNFILCKRTKFEDKFEPTLRGAMLTQMYRIRR